MHHKERTRKRVRHEGLKATVSCTKDKLTNGIVELRFDSFSATIVDTSLALELERWIERL